MTHEEAYFHMILLQSGYTDIYDSTLNAYLEKEDPLSDIVLSLSFCETQEKAIHCLYDYTVDKGCDMQTVARYLRFYVKERYENGSMSAEDCLAAFHSFLIQTDAYHEKPWSFWETLSNCYWYVCSSCDEMDMPLPVSLKNALSLYLETGEMTELNVMRYLNFTQEEKPQKGIIQRLLRRLLKRK